MIKPTVGRIVWYYPCDQPEPLAAIVSKVHSDTLVNLGIFAENGMPWGATSVPLLQEGEPSPKNAGYCRWMPYQIGQAARTEEAEKAAGKN